MGASLICILTTGMPVDMGSPLVKCLEKND